MISQIDSIQTSDLEEARETIDEVTMKQSYHELTQSLINVKNNVMACIHDLESTIQVKPSLIHTMRNTMKDIECAKEAIYIMKKCNPEKSS